MSKNSTSCSDGSCNKRQQNCIVFDGSSGETVAYANTFWQSAQMVPAPESGLCCSSITQRLQQAPPGHQPIIVTHPKQEAPPKLQEYIQRYRDEEELDQFQKLQLAKDRQERQRSVFRKQRAANQAAAEMLGHTAK